MSVLPKEYIGDGIYIEDKGYEVDLTTSDGSTVLNRIVIEPREWMAIKAYFKRIEEGHT